MTLLSANVWHSFQCQSTRCFSTSVTVLLQSAMLQGVLDSRVSTLKKQEDGQTFAATSSSITVVRLREIQRGKQHAG